MYLWELFIVALALSADAFAVSVCKGLSSKNLKSTHYVITSFYFGCFQALMPLAGFLLGVNFQKYIETIDHLIALVFLSVIGINMMLESSKNVSKTKPSFSPQVMIPLAVATSIDALAVGVTFAFLKVNILPVVLFIGIITFLFSATGLLIGHKFGAKYKSTAELAGGFILVAMGIKIFIEHTFF